MNCSSELNLGSKSEKLLKVLKVADLQIRRQKRDLCNNAV